MTTKVMTTKINVEIKGVSPLLMHSPNGLKKSDATSRGAATYDPEIEAKKALYLNQAGTICIPSSAVLGTIREGSKDRKVPGKGKKSYKQYIMSGITINPEMIPLDHKGDYEIDSRPVVIQRARIMRSRPRFDEWGIKFQIEILDDVYIKPPVLQEILGDAGRYNGLLDFRPQFGRFEVTKFEIAA